MCLYKDNDRAVIEKIDYDCVEGADTVILVGKKMYIGQVVPCYL